MKFAKKSLGQNFLIDQNVIAKIVNLTNIKDKHVFEIGPGKGALTKEILTKNPKSLTLIEKDNLLSSELKLKYINNTKIKIYNDDILNFDFENKIKRGTIIFGNLPYNISSQILVNIIKFKKWPPNYSKLILMFQKELAERIIGKFGTSKYGRLSILSNYRLKVLERFNISPNCFFPKPKVESTILLFNPKKIIINKFRNLENLEKITNLFFSNKRKMINKVVKKIFSQKQIKLFKNLDLNSRPSDLTPKQYYNITEIFEKN